MKKKFLSMFVVSLMLTGGLTTFVSCSDDDYGDDVKKNEASIATLNSQLAALQAALDQAKTDAQTAHAQFVTQTELNNMDAAFKAAAQEAAAIAKAEAITEAINQCKALIAGKADQAALDALAARVNSIDATLNKLGDMATKSDLAAAQQNLQDQINALNYLKSILPEGTDFNAVLQQIADLQKELADVKNQIAQLGSVDVSELTNKMNQINQKVNAFSEDINVLTVLINKILTSVTLKPALYIDGIEAISFDYLAYYPVVAGSSGNTVVSGSKLRRVDTGETFIDYRLNPNTVELSSIDVDNISFVGHLADKVESRAGEQSPVLFHGVAGYQNGVMTVSAKRNPDVDITNNDGKVWVTAIKVPRKANAANGTEYAEVYSEYSMVVEQTFAPQIAAVDLSKSAGQVKLIPGKNAYGFVKDNPVIKEVMAGQGTTGWSATKYHYYDKGFIYETNVDADQSVTLEIPFNQTFDLSQLVTGCKKRDYPDREESTHINITREQLAAYGLEFSFAIPKEQYLQDVDNKTNQQEFAKIQEDGKTIISTTPEGKVQNEAVIGKEPIIMAMLKDKDGYLVDERYFKIKWAGLEKVEEEQKTLDLGDLGGLQEWVLDPCGETTKFNITWRDFIDKVYAQIGDNGISQADFETYYPDANRVVAGDYWKIWHKEGDQALNGKYNGGLPVIKNTTNEHGDALVATWHITAEDVERVICDNNDITKAKDNFKTIRATVTMTPTKASLPIIKFGWIVKVTLPSLPSLVGYYDQYWFEKYDVVDVLPVQYNTPAQKNGNYYGTGSYDKCVYDFNLTNAFVYDQEAGLTKYIVKNLGNCGQYDIQFRKPQTMSVWGTKPYTNSWTNGNEPAPESVLWSDFVGYKLFKGVDQALQMYWVQVAGMQDYTMMSTPVDYISWENKVNWRSAKLFADSNYKKGLQGLLNPLSQDNETSELGQKQPVRTHNNKVNMGIWSRINTFNYVLVKNYDLCLIAPLRINALSHDGAFEDGHVSGTTVTFGEIFSMTDFRGYLVAKDATAAIKAQYTAEQGKYSKELYDYYQVEDANIDLNGITYNFKNVNGTVQIDDTKSSWMSAADLYRLTNGNLNFSIERNGNELTFFNNGGSNIESMCYARIPCTVDYGFGSAMTDILVPIYPHGKK